MTPILGALVLAAVVALLFFLPDGRQLLDEWIEGAVRGLHAGLVCIRVGLRQALCGVVGGGHDYVHHYDVDRGRCLQCLECDAMSPGVERRKAASR